MHLLVHRRYTLSLEIQTPIDFVMLQSDIELEILEQRLALKRKMIESGTQTRPRRCRRSTALRKAKMALIKPPNTPNKKRFKTPTLHQP